MDVRMSSDLERRATAVAAAAAARLGGMDEEITNGICGDRKEADAQHERQGREHESTGRNGSVTLTAHLNIALTIVDLERLDQDVNDDSRLGGSAFLHSLEEVLQQLRDETTRWRGGILQLGRRTEQGVRFSGHRQTTQGPQTRSEENEKHKIRVTSASTRESQQGLECG
jgi:hypothetical protein